MPGLVQDTFSLGTLDADSNPVSPLSSFGVRLSYDNSDFDTNRTIAIRLLATHIAGLSGLTSNAVTVTAVVEPALAQVTGVTVTPSPGQLRVTWTAVSEATGYKVQWKSGVESYNISTRQATPTGTSHTIPNLTGGTEYTVRVSATKPKAPDNFSTEETGTAGLTQVTGVQVTAGTRELAVTWTAVSGATGYKVQWKSGRQAYNTTDRQATTNGTNHTITSLSSAAYTLRVLATRSGLTDGPASNEQVVAPLGNTDYDQNNNNLIDVTTLAQLDAIRYDLDGNGSPTGNINAYNLAFLGRATDMGCQSTCTGYELMNDLNFDENGNGSRDDTYNTGAGWNPMSTFTATFQGNGHVIDNLFINRPTTTINIGLFGVSTGVLSQLGLVNVAITGGNNTGGLVGDNRGTVSTSYVTGRVTGHVGAGGLVGANGGSRSVIPGTVLASYARVQVRGNSFVGGLVGINYAGPITASYATGSSTSGLVGIVASGTITASYWDTTSSGVDDDADTTAPEGKTTTELQTPTGYTGIYENWNVNVDGETGNDNPWAFGTSSHYPVLRYGRTQTQINAQFEAQPGDAPFAATDIDQNYEVNEQDALLMYRTYLPGLRGAGVAADDRERATAWQENGRTVGGDLNGDGRITEQDALIMFYAYQFRALLQNHATLRQLLFNGLRGSGSQQMPPTDTTYREFLRRALRLR